LAENLQGYEEKCCYYQNSEFQKKLSVQCAQSQANGRPKVEGGGLYVINKPVQKMEGKAHWSLVDPSHILSDLDLSISNICVVTTYKNIYDDETLAFVGSIKG